MDAVARFAELVDRPVADVELARAALAFAVAADSRLDADAWLAEIDRLAVGVSHFEALRQRLFVEEGFAGATGDYYNPDNSLLHRVLERRRGIPISLSVVAIEVGPVWSWKASAWRGCSPTSRTSAGRRGSRAISSGCCDASALPGMATRATLQVAEMRTTQGRFRDAARELEATASQADAVDRQRLLQIARTVRARLN